MAVQNLHEVYFSEDKKDEPLIWTDIETKNPDTTPPNLDINRINVVATPTNPDNPNGETVVDIHFYVRDDISGYGIGGVNIRDPLGNIHHRWHYPHDNRGMYVIMSQVNIENTPSKSCCLWGVIRGFGA